MLSVIGYYDGTAVRPLEKIVAKPNQRVIITITDEFIDPTIHSKRKGMRGALSEFADPDLLNRENGAWAEAMREKHGNS